MKYNPLTPTDIRFYIYQHNTVKIEIQNWQWSQLCNFVRILFCTQDKVDIQQNMAGRDLIDTQAMEDFFLFQITKFI